MKRAVVLAYNPNNAGMFSVDLAALHFFSGLGLPVDFFCAHVSEEVSFWKYGFMSINYLRDAHDLNGYDEIIYWGDFTTNAQYGLNDFANREKQFRGIDNIQDAFSRWVDLFLPDPSRASGKKIISVGQNFQTLPQAFGKIHEDKLRKLYNNFSHICVRDSYSFYVMENFLGSEGGQKISKGIDCAFLLNTAGTKNTIMKKKKAVIAFGRTRVANCDRALDVLKGKGYELVNLKNWHKLPKLDGQWVFDSMINEVKSADLIFTDTYHLLINSLREGVPVIGFGAYGSSPLGTLSDFKKDRLLDDFGISNRYIKIKDKKFSEEQLSMIDVLSDLTREHDEWSCSEKNIQERILEFRLHLSSIIS